MPTIRKFQFDTSFDIEDGQEPAPVEDFVEEEIELPSAPPTFSEEEMARSRAEGYAEGHGAGIAEAGASAERAAAEALTQIAERLSALKRSLEDAVDQRERSAVAVAAAIARKILPEVAHDNAVTVLESMVRECVPRVIDEPRLVIRVSDSLIDAVQSRLAGIATDNGFGGQVILVGDAGLTATDCRVEWSDGGAEYDSVRVWQEIEAAIGRFLHPTGAEVGEHQSVSNDGATAEPPAADEPTQ